MNITRDSSYAVIERIRRDPAFATALLDETFALLLHGENETAWIVLRDVVNAIFEPGNAFTPSHSPADSFDNPN